MEFAWIIRKFPTGACGRERPWVVDSRPDVDGKVVAQVIAGPTTNPEWEKIAPLIAAAPKFLAEAKALIDRHDENARTCNFHKCGCEDCMPFRRIIEKIEGNQS